APRVIPGVAAPPSAQTATPATPQPAGAAGPREEFNTALELYRAGQYESAETGLKSFLVKNPKSRLAPDAIYYLGETYFQRGRHREAADQYLKIATEYAQTTRAPDSMLRLGLALQAMGAKEQACATLGEIARKYPAASAAVRGADREMKRARC
ncbi:MAG: tol-pal system protein YbgF, partial [Methylobacteriaceae bacterium]|nr:tol-pal system protein YbgF [Methylobacteriaceae bacterium]